LSTHLLVKKFIDFIDACEHGCGVRDQKNSLVKAIHFIDNIFIRDDNNQTVNSQSDIY
jgi:hypothetical protein